MKNNLFHNEVNFFPMEHSNFKSDGKFLQITNLVVVYFSLNMERLHEQYDIFWPLQA